MNFKLSIAVIIVIAVIVIASVVYFETSNRTTGSTIPLSVATQSGANVQFMSSSLTVGFDSGLWQLSLRNAGTVAVSKIKVFLETPIESLICSGTDLSARLLREILYLRVALLSVLPMG